MDIFIMWMAPIAAICIGIIVLTAFFTVLGAIKDRFPSVKYIKIKKLLKDSDFVTIHLTSGKAISNVKFVGFTDPSSFKGIPYQLANMVVYESTDGRRILVRADTIRMMEQQETSKSNLPM
jgi:hypothetical protein